MLWYLLSCVSCKNIQPCSLTFSFVTPSILHGTLDSMLELCLSFLHSVEMCSCRHQSIPAFKSPASITIVADWWMFWTSYYKRQLWVVGDTCGSCIKLSGCRFAKMTKMHKRHREDLQVQMHLFLFKKENNVQCFERDCWDCECLLK